MTDELRHIATAEALGDKLARTDHPDLHRSEAERKAAAYEENVKRQAKLVRKLIRGSDAS
ncbi:hypothetical protein [Chelativorans sp.]|uniref:hypothetical protein n=1 Tax=Chelativorans sp. TaxID=2203393 RepID=UPI00281269B0|nr:hypothetical protein [Chelativorans sp.]